MTSWQLLEITGSDWLPGDVVLLTLADPNGGDLPAFEAGSHVDVEPVPGLIRQYSLLGDPADRRRYRIAVKLEPNSRGGSRAMHELALRRLHGNLTLKVGQPRQNFPLSPSASKHVLLAAGIGITPMLSMARALIDGGTPFSLDYFAAAGHVALEREVRAFLGPTSAIVHEGIGRAEIESTLDRRLAAGCVDTHYYACGPSGFLDLAERLAEAHHAADRFHLERFAADQGVAQPFGRALRIVLSKSGREVAVGADQTLADALAANGVPCALSCRQGICGTCVTTVVEGIPDHRDSVLTPEEHASNSLICLCVSRAHTPSLVLDL